MGFLVRRLFIKVIGWTHSPYSQIVEEESERMVELVIRNAAKAVEHARAERPRHKSQEPSPHECDFIAAMIDKLQEAGF